MICVTPLSLTAAKANVSRDLQETPSGGHMPMSLWSATDAFG
ncbi:hypothetical protein ACPAVH_38280 [Enterobacteriaceae bacterium TYF_5]